MLYKVYRSLKEHTESWDSLLPANHHLRSEQLLPLELCSLRDLGFSYVFFYRDLAAAPLAIAYFQHVHFTTRHYQYPLLKNKLLAVAEKSLMRRGYHILVCGNLFRIDFPGIFHGNSTDLLPEIFETLEKYYATLRPVPHAILIKDFRKDSANYWVPQFHYRIWPGDLTMKLDLNPEWRHFSDYVAALKHKYAQRVRRIQNRALSLERRELELADLIKYGDRLETLLGHVVSRQTIRLVIANQTYFWQMKKLHGATFRVIGYFDHNELIAFSSHILHTACWELHYIGMDYSKNEKFLLYFNMMYDGIAMAIENKKPAVELGRTAREAKSMLGAKPIYFSSYFKLRGWLVNLLVSRFADSFNKRAGEKWQERNPFKSPVNKVR